jgi:DNA-binding NarL/FixJ family response regulator
LVADSVSKVRYALGVLLRQRPGIEVVGEATDADEVIRKAAETDPDVVLLDWKLRDLAHDAPLQALRDHGVDAYVIVLGDRPETRGDAVRAGADAFVSKVDPPERLLAAIDSARPCTGEATRAPTT